VPVDSLAPRAKAALAAVRRTRKDTAAPPPRPTPPHAPDRLLYRLDLEGPTGKKSFHFDDQTIPAKARPLISYLSARALPVRPLK
jgi:hypothetical protein